MKISEESKESQTGIIKQKHSGALLLSSSVKCLKPCLILVAICLVLRG